VIINVFYVLSAVAFPAFARARSEPERMRRGYLTSLRLQAVYGAGAGTGLAIVAPMLVRVVFGVRWHGSIAPLEALACYAAFRSIGTSATDVYKAAGRPGVAASMSALRLAVLAPALVIAARSGIVTVSVVQAIAALCFAAIMQSVAIRIVGVPVRAFVRALAPAFSVAAGVAVGAGAVRAWLPGPDAVRLFAAVVAGAGAGAAGLFALDRGFVTEMRELRERARPVPQDARP
jgi:PST family polysaccharide transporter